MNTKDLFLSLLKSAIKGEDVSNEAKESLESGNIATLFKVAKAHDMAHIVSYVLKDMEKSDLQEWKALKKEEQKAIARYKMMEAEIKEISTAFENAGIDYMLLKGAVVRQVYPLPWMRTSCDIDILVHTENLEKAVNTLVENCAYSTDGKKTYHDVSLFSPFGMHLELHHNIKENTDKYDELLTQVWEFSQKESENGHRYVQTNEFLMFHLIAHCAYHFVGGGCGLRSVLDIWLLSKNLNLDKAQLDLFLEKTELTKFYSAILELGETWFGEEQSEKEEIKSMELYILLGGVYGTKEQGMVSKQIKKGGKFKYIWSRIFMPYRDLAILYPVIKKHKLLTPFCQIARWFKAIFNRKKIAKEVKIASSVNQDQVDATKKLLESLDL